MAVFRRRQILLLDTQATYQSTVLGIAQSSLLAYWPLTETLGTTASDVSGNARHGTYSGVTLAQIAGPGASMGQAGLWDGVNDQVNISAIVPFVDYATTVTISCWYRVLNAAVWSDGQIRLALSLYGNSTNWLGWNKMGTPSNRIRHTHDAATLVTAKNTDTSSTAWLHSAVVVSGGFFSAYFGGVAIGTPTSISAIPVACSAAQIGAHGENVFFWSGYLAHCAVWSTALSAAQMQVLATAR